jgi:hypothetical protein
MKELVLNLARTDAVSWVLSESFEMDGVVHPQLLRTEAT